MRDPTPDLGARGATSIVTEEKINRLCDLIKDEVWASDQEIRELVLDILLDHEYSPLRQPEEE